MAYDMLTYSKSLTIIWPDVKQTTIQIALKEFMFDTREKSYIKSEINLRDHKKSVEQTSDRVSPHHY